MANYEPEWHSIHPNLKKDIPNEEGEYIADPYLVLRGSLKYFIGAGTSVTLLTPPITGRLERIVIIPDHTNQPGDNFGLTCVQVYAEGPDADGGEAVDSLDLLNGLGVNIPNDEITHFHTMNISGTQNPIVPQVLVQDRLLFTFDEEFIGGVSTLCFIYLYFSAAGGADGISDGSAVVAGFTETQIVEPFTYVVAGGEQEIGEITYANTDGKSKHIVGSLDLSNFTAGRVITVRVKEEIDDVTERIIDKTDYTVGADEINPHFDFTSFRDVLFTMEIDIVEAGGISVPLTFTAIDIVA